MGWRWAAVALLAAALAPGAGASPLGLDAHVVTSEKPGGYDYAADVFVADVAGTLTLTNVDLRPHDVVSFANGPDSNPWCERYRTRACPLFASPLVGLGEQAPVEGLAQLDPLADYAFYCTAHPWMVATLKTI